MNKAFVTGASGFIGSNLVERLARSGCHVTALCKKTGDVSGSGVSFAAGDILEPETFAGRMKGCDVLFHCAAYVSFQKSDFGKSYDTNVLGTKNVLEAAAATGIKKVIHLSACAVLGCSDKEDAVIDEGAYPAIERDNIYAYTKKLAEDEVQGYARKGLDVSIANIATVYGPGDARLNSGSVIKKISEGGMLLAPPGGTSFVGMDDLVEGLILMSGCGRPGERYILCAENMSYDILCRRIAKALGAKEPRFILPRSLYLPAVLAGRIFEIFSESSGKRVNLITGSIVREMFKYKYYNNAKAVSELGWRPKQTLEDAVGKAYKFYKEKGLIR